MMPAMLAKETNLSSASALVLDDEWSMEQKVDGHRILLHISGPRFDDPSSATPYNRNGEPYAGGKFPPDQAALACEHFRVGDLVDGELVNGTFWAFDLPIRSGTERFEETFTERRAHLRHRKYPNTLPTARLREAKARLMRKVRDEGGEGVIIKHLYSPYEPGARSANMLKAKYVKTIDCVVSAVKREGRDAIGLSVFGPDGLTEIGACSTIGKVAVELGDVVEVRYLYANNPEEPRLVQPVLLDLRSDKGPADCTIDQLHFTNKIVLP